MEQYTRRLGDIEVILQAIEARLLGVIRGSGTGTTDREQANTEVALLVQDLRGLLQRIQTRLERRDLSYDDETYLKELLDRCSWLLRKAREEEVFLRKLTLEEELRRMIPDEAYAIYEALQEAEEEESSIAQEDPGNQKPVADPGEAESTDETFAAVPWTSEE